MKIVYFGNNPRGLVCLQKLLEESENIVAIVAHPEQKLSPEQGQNVKTVAIEKGLPVIQPKDINSPKSAEWLKSFMPDLFILSGYNQILKSNVLKIPRKGTINLHGGKLPEYRGVAPINWQIINGETVGGAAVLYVEEGIDTGDIIISQEYSIGIEDTAKSVLDITLKIFPEMLLKAVNLIKHGKVKPKKQDLEKGCYYTRRYMRDGRIDWKNMTALEVYNLIRALVEPYPGAFTYNNGEKVIIWKASLLKETIKGISGRVVLRREGGVVVIAKDMGLLIELVQHENGETMKANDYFNKTGIDLA